MGKKKHVKRTVYKPLEEKTEAELESQHKRSIERHHKNINKDYNDDKIEDKNESKKKSSKRIEVKPTNYENIKEDMKNNQIEDKIDFKESLKVGVKTEAIEDETEQKKKKVGSHEIKKNKKKSKSQYDDKKLQNKQERDTNLRNNEISDYYFNSSEKNTNQEKIEPVSSKIKKNKIINKNNSYQLDDHEKNKNKNYKLDKKTISTNDDLEEIDEDIFNLSKETSLAHCVAVDLRMGAGIAVEFKRIFGGVGKLIDQSLKVGDVGIVNRHGQNVFYLITKKYSNGKPNIRTMEMALKSLLKQMKEQNLNKLGIPKIGCGLDGLDWSSVKLLIEKIFNGSGIHITVCVPSKIIERKAPKLLNVMITSKNLWEMEEKTDRIIFIDLENFSTDIWTKDIIEKVNSKYPFKEILKKDMENKKFCPGDILHYNIKNENIFCAFITHKQTKYSSIENAFNAIVKYTKDYMYMAIQSGPIQSGENFEHISKMVLIFRAISKSSELWLCGDNTQANNLSYDMYCKSNRESMNFSSTYYSPKQNNYSSPKSMNYNSSKQTNYNSPKQTNYNSPNHLNYKSPNFKNFKYNYITEKVIGHQNKKGSTIQLQFGNEKNKIPDFKDNYDHCYSNYSIKKSIQNQEQSSSLHKLHEHEHNLQNNSSSEN